jgi:hypothetical protein
MPSQNARATVMPGLLMLSLALILGGCHSIETVPVSPSPLFSLCFLKVEGSHGISIII